VVPSIATLAVASQATPLLAAIVGFFGLIVGATVGALLNQRGNRKLQEIKIFFDSLEWFTKGRQRRNVGITAVEAVQTNPRLGSFSIPLLIGTAIFLLRESHDEEENESGKMVHVPNRTEHDLYNMDRIMALLLSKENTAVLENKIAQKRKAYKRLHDTIKNQPDWEKQNPKKGLRVKHEDLDNWKKELRKVLENFKET
jgi:hypothetical protein